MGMHENDFNFVKLLVLTIIWLHSILKIIRKTRQSITPCNHLLKWQLYTKLSQVPTMFIRLEFNTKHSEYYTQIDAVQLTGTPFLINEQPLVKATNLPDNVLPVTHPLEEVMMLDKSMNLNQTKTIRVWRRQQLVNWTRKRQTKALIWFDNHTTNAGWHALCSVRPA